MLALQDISYHAGSKIIVQNVSFEMSTADFIGLLGPNGSGKTTLINLISGVLEPAGGEILLDGKNLSEWPIRERARKIAVVPQESSFVFPFTALEIVLMGRFAYQKSFAFDSASDLETAREVMQQTDCRQFAHRPIDTLSGGERQRVLLARALAQNPRFLLLDEPASHLDLKHRAHIFGLLRQLNRSGVGILCVVHDINLAVNYCQRVLLLKEGVLVHDGSAETVLQESSLQEVFEIPFRRVSDKEKVFFFPEESCLE